MANGNAGPGWYPTGDGRDGYWNGSEWTEFREPTGAVADSQSQRGVRSDLSELVARARGIKIKPRRLAVISDALRDDERPIAVFGSGMERIERGVNIKKAKADVLLFGVLAVTDHRLLFASDHLLGARSLEDIPLTQITSVTQRKQPLAIRGSVETVLTSGSTVVFNIGKDDLVAAVAAINDARAAASRPQTAAMQVIHTAGPSIPEQIKQLADLRDAGILTEAEFDAKKAQLLAQM